MTRNELVLAALAAAGENASLTPVQVQKLFFLIDREISGFVGGPHFSFAPYDYGPFDRSVYSALAELQERELVQSSPLGRYRTYSLTAAGYRSGLNNLNTLAPQAARYIRDLAAWIRGLSFAQLVTAIYKKYPDMKVNSVFNG